MDVVNGSPRVSCSERVRHKSLILTLCLHSITLDIFYYLNIESLNDREKGVVRSFIDLKHQLADLTYCRSFLEPNEGKLSKYRYFYFFSFVCVDCI